MERRSDRDHITDGRGPPYISVIEVWVHTHFDLSKDGCLDGDC
jgi:hypothetical protein